MPFVTMLYAGILGLMSIAVAFPAGQLRGKLGIPLGDGGSVALLHAMRRQANFIEVVPMALILIGLLEMSGVSRYAIHGLGAALVFFRLCHALRIQGRLDDRGGARHRRGRQRTADGGRVRVGDHPIRLLTRHGERGSHAPAMSL